MTERYMKYNNGCSTKKVIKKGQFTWCIEINTTDMPRRKLMVKVYPKNAAEARPVNIVATVDEYFFKIVSAVYFS